MSLPLAEALALDDINLVLDEIVSRRKLHHKMVGRLYPNIVADEVGQLVQRYEELGGKRLADDLYQRENPE